MIIVMVMRIIIINQVESLTHPHSQSKLNTEAKLKPRPKPRIKPNPQFLHQFKTMFLMNS